MSNLATMRPNSVHINNLSIGTKVIISGALPEAERHLDIIGKVVEITVVNKCTICNNCPKNNIFIGMKLYIGSSHTATTAGLCLFNIKTIDGKEIVYE